MSLGAISIVISVPSILNLFRFTFTNLQTYRTFCHLIDVLDVQPSENSELADVINTYQYQYQYHDNVQQPINSSRIALISILGNLDTFNSKFSCGDKV